MAMSLVGILNVTPDSFSDGGKFSGAAAALTQFKQLMAAGASIIDIGAEATNPKAMAISPDEEWERLEPVLRAVAPLLNDYTFSIDTRNASTVRRVAKLVAGRKFYVSDVTTFLDDELCKTTAELGLTAIVSHSPLAAEGDIQKIHATAIDDIGQVVSELDQQVTKLIEFGVKPDKIVLDPGIGFGKTMRLNWQLLEFAKYVPGVPLMIGFSNKRFLATDPRTGEAVENIDRFGAAANKKAADIAIAACKRNGNELLLRVHDPAIYLT